MHQGNWKCSSCAGTITELPFMPRSESGLTCRTCYAKQKGGEGGSQSSVQEMPVSSAAPYDIPDEAGVAGDPGPVDDGLNAVPTSSERVRFEGDWKCADCDSAITSLPFQPRDTSNLKCIDCFKRSKA